MHLLYSRFFIKVLGDMGLIDFREPFTRLYNQGIILGPDGLRMSKSRGNVINPDEYVQTKGADTVRMLPDVHRTLGRGRAMESAGYRRSRRSSSSASGRWRQTRLPPRTGEPMNQTHLPPRTGGRRGVVLLTVSSSAPSTRPSAM